MPHKEYTALVSEIWDHTKNFRELGLSVQNEEFRFKAGQFLMLQVPSNESQGKENSEKESARLTTGAPKKIQRAYSLASSDKDSRSLRLIFKYIQNGAASEYVWSLNKGARLKFTGPFGKLTMKEPIAQRLIFLNTGSGISQHLSYLESRLEELTSRECFLFFGLNAEEDMYAGERLENLKSKLKHFDYQYVLFAPSSGWHGLKGFVQDHIKSLLQTDCQIYLCGNPSMIKDTKALLDASTFPKENIFAEAFV